MAYKNLGRKMPAKGLDRIAWSSLVLGLWISTYWVAYRLNFATALDSLTAWFPLYYPGQFISWTMEWGKLYPRIFIPALVVSALGFLGFIIISRKSKAQK